MKTELCRTIAELAVLVAMGLSCGCGRHAPSPVASAQAQAKVEEKTMAITATALKLSSTSIKEGQPISNRYTARGENHSPQLSWQDVPEGTHELAILMFDPDAPGGDFVHWIVYGIPATMTGLDMGLPGETHPDEREPFMQGRNDSGRTGYFGPLPPPGKPHHYHYRLYALDQRLNLPANVDKGRFRQAIKGHVLAQSEIVATYETR